jgi:hypothetical protein
MKGRGRKPSAEARLASMGLRPGTTCAFRCMKCGREWNVAGLWTNSSDKHARRQWWLCPKKCNATRD